MFFCNFLRFIKKRSFHLIDSIKYFIELKKINLFLKLSVLYNLILNYFKPKQNNYGRPGNSS